MARGVSPADWSHPLPDPWEPRFLMLCDAIDTGRLSSTQHPTGMERWHRVCLLDVRRFLADHGAGEEWAWLRETCQDWSQRWGRELPEPETVGPREPALPKKRLNRPALEKWYKDRVANRKVGDPIPSQDKDFEDAKAKFGKRVTRIFVRELRRKLAPAEWNLSTTGPKPKIPSK